MSSTSFRYEIVFLRAKKKIPIVFNPHPPSPIISIFRCNFLSFLTPSAVWLLLFRFGHVTHLSRDTLAKTFLRNPRVQLSPSHYQLNYHHLPSGHRPYMPTWSSLNESTPQSRSSFLCREDKIIIIIITTKNKTKQNKTNKPIDKFIQGRLGYLWGGAIIPSLKKLLKGSATKI